jgi:hypothetical protein
MKIPAALRGILTLARPFLGICGAGNPICGELWQPVAFVRQQMLANSFSYLIGENDWRITGRVPKPESKRSDSSHRCHAQCVSRRWPNRMG